MNCEACGDVLTRDKTYWDKMENPDPDDAIAYPYCMECAVDYGMLQDRGPVKIHLVKFSKKRIPRIVIGNKVARIIW